MTMFRDRRKWYTEEREDEKKKGERHEARDARAFLSPRLDEKK